VPDLTAQVPAAVATSPPDIIIGLMPRVLLKIIPLSAPAMMLFVVSSACQLAMTKRARCNASKLRTLAPPVAYCRVYSVINHGDDTSRVAQEWPSSRNSVEHVVES
jgi:hypothetical protein